MASSPGSALNPGGHDGVTVESSTLAGEVLSLGSALKRGGAATVETAGADKTQTAGLSNCAAEIGESSRTTVADETEAAAKPPSGKSTRRCGTRPPHLTPGAFATLNKLAFERIKGECGVQPLTERWWRRSYRWFFMPVAAPPAAPPCRNAPVNLVAALRSGIEQHGRRTRRGALCLNTVGERI